MMIALAAHEEEGPREALEGPKAGTEGQVPDTPLPAEPACDISSGDGVPARVCGVRPGWVLLEELRLGLLSARVRMFDRERFPAC